jgi:hypothetical protein
VLTVLLFTISPADAQNAFESAQQKQVGAIMTVPGSRMFAERKRIVDLAGKYRLPAIYPNNGYADEGDLMFTGQTSRTIPGARLFTWTRS